jgi:carboxypeptidase T
MEGKLGNKVRGLCLFMALLMTMILVASGGSTSGAFAGISAESAQVTGANADALVMRVYFKDAAERDRLATELGAEETGTQGGFLTIISDRDRYSSLLARGLRVEIDQQATDVVRAFPGIGADSPETFYGGYRTVEEMQAFLDQKVAAHPTLAEKVDIGDSWCKTHPGQCTQPNSWNGFDLWIMHITNRNIPGPKPVFWYDAGIHSREIATPEVAMRFIDYLLNNYGVDADATWLVDWHDIWVMPMLNPDGHHMNESNGEGTPTLHRKNADRDDGCTSYDLFGTDINRNFDFRWGCCGGSSGNACDQTYRGPAPESEEETQALAAKVRQLIPDQRGPNESDPAPLTTTGTLINMHSNAAQNLYPWGYTSSYAPNRTDLRNIGRHMSSQQVVPVGNNYEYCQNTECLYIVDGDEKNWAYGELGIPGYSLELSGSGFFPRYACLDNPPGVNGCNDNSVGLGLWPQNRGALLHHAKIVRAPYLLTRGPDANNPVTTPMTVTQGTNSELTATINYNWSGSDGQPNAYLQNVQMAEYYIDVPPWAGGSPISMLAQDGAYDETTEPVRATIDTSTIPVGRHIIFVRGRGVNDYEGHGSWGPISATWLTITSGGGATATPIVPTVTVPASTATSIIPSATVPVPPTGTSVVPSATRTSAPPSPTGGSRTPTPFPSGTGTAMATSTTMATATPCTLTFTDVPPTDPFYADIRCLACRGIISGYADGTFRPYNSITRGQIAKMVSNAAGFQEPVSGQTYEDVLPTNTFYEFIQRLSSRGHMGGYPCGQRTTEPCNPPENRPYFRPVENATRGQLSKIVSNAAGFGDPVSGQFYTDVEESNPFYVEIMRLTQRGVMSGYQCGGPGEPCDPQNRPYFRWANPVTRGQASKIVANAFYPNCSTP